MRLIIIACAIASILGVPAFGQGIDPLIGSWKLNLENSTASDPLVKSNTLTFTREGQNLTVTADIVDAQGQVLKIVFRHIYDGMPHPTTGSPDYDSSAYTRIGNTINGVRFREGKPVEVLQNVIVPGKTYTNAAAGIAANGQPYHYVMVFDRQ